MRKRDIIKQKFEEFVTALENFQPEKIGHLAGWMLSFTLILSYQKCRNNRVKHL